MYSAKIIAITQPLITDKKYVNNENCNNENRMSLLNRDEGGYYIENCLSVEEFVAYCARVSNPSNQNNTLTASKLLKYLTKNKHWSPFQMVNIVQEINCTRDIGRQILRHTSFSFQEFSQRYADPSQLGFTFREARLQDKNNRQNSLEVDDDWLEENWQSFQNSLMEKSKEIYNWALEHGIAKEQARAVLPEGLIMSKLYMNGTLRSWIHYCNLRMKNGTQKEHMDVAKQCWENLLIYFPCLKNILIEEQKNENFSRLS